MTYGEIIVSVLIVVLILFATWRAGQVNPVGTGSLVRRITQLEVQVAEIDGRMDGIDKAVQQLVGTTDATNVAVAAMRLEMAGDRGVSERTWNAVARLQDYFIDQALDQAFSRERRP